MVETESHREEAALRELFATALPVPDDDEFPAVVLRRIRRRAWVRRVVLGVAVVLGASLAAQPAYELVQVAGGSLSGVLSQWGSVALPSDHRIIGIGLLAVLLGPLLVSMLEE